MPPSARPRLGDARINRIQCQDGLREACARSDALYPAGVNGSVPEAYQNTVKYVTAFHHYIQRVRMGLKWLLERCYDSATDLRSRLNPVYCSMSAPRISTVNEHKHENVFLAND